MLNEIPFSDLYIFSNEEKGTYLIKGKPGTPGLSSLPPKYNKRAEVLLFKLNEFASNGKTEFFFNFDKLNFRITKFKTTDSIFWCCRNLMNNNFDLEALGFNPRLINRLIKISDQGGLLLCSGITGSGKTTSATGIFKRILEEYGDLGLTIEDPPEVPFQGKIGENGFVCQVPVDEDNLNDFLKKSIRTNARYIFVGEARDNETKRLILSSAVAGHFTITTLHATDPISAIQSLIMAFGPHEQQTVLSMLSDNFGGVLCQTLKTQDNQLIPNFDFLIPNDENKIEITGLIRTNDMAGLKNYVNKW